MLDPPAAKRYELIELADALLRVANANMVRALRKVSVARGCDPRDYVLAVRRGRGTTRLCDRARAGDQAISLPSGWCIPAARGIGLAEPARHRAAGVYRPYTNEALVQLQSLFSRLTDEANAKFLDEFAPAERGGFSPAWKFTGVRLRYRGVDAAITIDEPRDGDFAAAFSLAHERLHGYTHAERPLEIVAARVEVVARRANPLAPSERIATRFRAAERHTVAQFDGAACRTSVFRREELRAGDLLIGPAIVHEFASTTVIDPGWQAEVMTGGELLVAETNSSSRPERDAHDHHAAPDPALLEIFDNQFAGIAEQMGVTLRNTAGSVNVKERLDFSVAIFTAAGELVVNAPHIPVHLGAMGQTVRHILADNPAMQPDDVFVTNDPYRGGSHLPDLTVVTPVHEPLAAGADRAANPNAPRAIRFFTASRAHHAEIGGIVPGSMPPQSRRLSEEGVLIRNFKLVAAGESRLEEFAALLSSAPYPSRAIGDNLADVAAQVAANRLGALQLEELGERAGWPLVSSYMRHIQSAAERKSAGCRANLRLRRSANSSIGSTAGRRFASR